MMHKRNTRKLVYDEIDETEIGELKLKRHGHTQRINVCMYVWNRTHIHTHTRPMYRFASI